MSSYGISYPAVAVPGCFAFPGMPGLFHFLPPETSKRFPCGGLLHSFWVNGSAFKQPTVGNSVDDSGKMLPPLEYERAYDL